MSKSKQRSKQPASGRDTHLIEQTLREVERLARRQAWAEAHETLAGLAARYPNRTDVLQAQASLAEQSQDHVAYQNACERLLTHFPHDPALMRALTGAYLRNGYPVLAYRMLGRFLAEWPDHEYAAQVRETRTLLAAQMAELLAELGIAGEAGLEIAALHEEAQAALQRGDAPNARQGFKKLLRLHPDFIPARNNLSLLYWLEGKIEEAITTARQVLAQEPTNLHALANLTRYLCLSGQEAEARASAERLKAVEVQGYQPGLKRAEALSYLGDDAGVLAVVEAAEEAGEQEALLYHLGAVSALRQGDEGAAERYWDRALTLAPGLAVVHANRAERAKPPHERHDPWPFEFANWLPGGAMAALREILTQAVATERVGSGLRRFLRRYPTVEAIVPRLLERGDPAGREFALRLAAAVQSPVLLDALHDFALAQHGPDRLRLDAAQVVSQSGRLPSGPVRLWVQGEWREIMLLGFEVSYEPYEEDLVHTPEVEALALAAFEALRDGDGEAAEGLLRQALALEPDAPDLANNLAMAYELQGRHDEAHALMKQVHEQHPDYFFARIGLAHKAIQAGEIEAAATLVAPLLQQQRMHISEFRALAQVEMALQLARGEAEGARSWLEMWQSMEPEHPDLPYWEMRVTTSYLASQGSSGQSRGLR